MKSVRGLIDHHCSKNRLSCYLDGQLSGRQAVRVREHLNECRICRDELESLRATIALLRAAPAPCMPRSVVIPESAVAAQCQVRRVDTTVAALRVGAVAVTLMLAILLSREAIQAIRPAQLQTVAVEMAADSGPALEGAGGGPGVLREAPAEREVVPGDEPLSTTAAVQVEALEAAKSAESATDADEEAEATPEELSLMAAPVTEGTASLVPPGEVAEDAEALAMESPGEAQAEIASSEDPGSTAQPGVMAKSPGSPEPASQETAPTNRQTLRTSSRVAAVILASVLFSLIGALFWIGRRRVSL